MASTNVAMDTYPEKAADSPPSSHQEKEEDSDAPSGKVKRSDENKPRFKSKWRIWKNVVVVSFAFMFLFTSFQSLSNLQSSLFGEANNLGPNGLSVIYGALIFSCLFIPPPLISVLGCKWTVALSMLTYVFYMVMHFFTHVTGPVYAGSALLGLGAAPLWSAKCSYLTEIAHDYGHITGISPDGTVNTFFGVFFLLFQSSQIWGNLISSYVLRESDSDFQYATLNDSVLLTCGRGSCPWTKSDNPNLEPVPQDKLFTLAGIYTGCACAAVLVIVIFLDQLPSEEDKFSPTRCCSASVWRGCKISPKLLVATVIHYFSDYRQILLTPLTIYSGLEQAFMTSDFTKAFISCPFSISMIGLIMICYGVVDALCSFGFGRLVQYVGRLPFFILGAAINYGLIATYLSLDLSQDSLLPYFFFAGLWGMADAIWQTQINALYGVLFVDRSEAAFANYRLWESLGFLSAFLYSGQLCVTTKVYILIGVLSLGMIGYVIIEVNQRRRAKASFSAEK